MIPCGQCIECRQTKAREWQVRLSEEIKEYEYKYFVTLTFSPKELQNLLFKTRLEECNAVAAHALRHALERYRKDHKVSLRHWFITELGHEGTERIHMHGLFFSNNPLEFIKKEEVPGKGFMGEWKYWKYGLIFVGNYVNQRTINYISKYITKIDTDHKGFVGNILASPGIGRSFIDRQISDVHKYRPKHTIDYYELPNGCKVKLPKYYKNKFLNEDERELVWREFMDTEKESIMGNTYLKGSDQRELINITEKAKEVNTFLDYGNDSKEWRKKPYNLTRRMLQAQHREEARKKMEEALKRNYLGLNDQKAKKLQISVQNIW